MPPAPPGQAWQPPGAGARATAPADFRHDFSPNAFGWQRLHSGTVVRCCNQIKSSLLGEEMLSGKGLPGTSGGMVRLSRQRRISV